MADNTLQYLRECNLFLYGRVAGDATSENRLDLSGLRIKFAVKTTDSPTPNTADIRVYNLDVETIRQIKKQYSRVVLQAGYPGNIGVIFEGSIMQVIAGRESATDTFIDILSGDGDRAYNYAVVNATLAAGASFNDQIGACMQIMSQKGVTQGYTDQMSTERLPRGKVLFGNTKNYMRTIANSTGTTWSVQKGKSQFVKVTSYLPGEAVVINSATGMIGAPQQTNDGVNVKTLLNPRIQVSGRVKLDNSNIQVQKLNLEQIGAAKGDVQAINAAMVRQLNADGIYQVFVCEHLGDTRGTEWYSNLICLSIDASANPRNSVQA